MGRLFQSLCLPFIIMQKKQPSTPAERSKRYRAVLRARGIIPKGGPRGRAFMSKSKWELAQFIALDGEGESVGELQKFTVGKDGKTYEAKEHCYTLLAASSGQSLYNAGKRLDTFDCLNFLLDLADSYPKSIFVIFAGGYDVNHMLMFGFDRETLQHISRGESNKHFTEKIKNKKTVRKYESGAVELKFQGIEYELEYRARKSLTIRRGLSWGNDSKGNLKKIWESKIILWDVFGFFQESFVGVTAKWLGKDWRHYDLIKDMKAKRGDFANVEQSKINAYNAAELETLVAIMEKVRSAIDGLDLQCSRWDGAGAVAAAIYKKHQIKQFKNETGKNLMTAVRTAYAGGRIEVCKIGCHTDFVYDYDINSAYPYVMMDLPCLAHGSWIQGRGYPPPGFTLVHCKYDFEEGQPFYPLFYRTESMQISFPAQGEGWYWYPEYEAATKCPGKLEVIEYYQFVPSCNHKPFHWIENYYKTRQQFIKNPTEDWQKGAEKIIKLGLNSLYGKTAQQIGGRGGKAPAYHQMEWAGYITSATRARLYTAAKANPSAVIGFATDGLFTTEKFPLDCSRTKAIGAWELKEPVPCGMTIAMAGVYWWHFDDGDYSHFSRGFDKESMRTPHMVLNAWKEGREDIDIPMHRLIGMGSACASESLWPIRGRFTQGYRTLCLNGKSHKRAPINIKKTKPHKHLVDLEPNLNIEYIANYQSCSFPYPIEWIDGDESEAYLADMELSRENEDTQNI